MIGRLRGTVAAKGAEGLLLEAGGVGFEVALPPRALADLPPVGASVVIYTHLHLREDAVALYGFPTAEERDLFRVLLGATGVGPRLALAILGTLKPADLRRAVLAADADTLTLVPGVGKRTAQRLILDLRARLEMPDLEEVPGAGSVAEVRGALEGLGYQPAEIRQALEGLPVDGEVEALLRSALRRLGKR
jgi:holliday junction DNA helicase RuvA